MGEAALSEAEGALEQEENKVLRASLEITQVRQEIERRLNQKDDEFNATKKNFAKAIDGMQMELESELDAENRRLGDAQKNMRKSERHIKELSYTIDEDKKNQERMQALIDQLQGKIKSYKKQIEEAEEIAALNLAKYRQVQSNLCMSVE